MYQATICNPPGGLVYGFPRIMPHEIMTPTEFRQWLLDCGYPENEITGAEENSEFWLEALTLEPLNVLLRENIVNVTFTKANGEERKMRCTLRREFLPEIEEGTEKKERKVSTEAARVWDLDKNSWRSFRLDSLTYIEAELSDIDNTTLEEKFNELPEDRQQAIRERVIALKEEENTVGT